MKKKIKNVITAYIVSRWILEYDHDAVRDIGICTSNLETISPQSDFLNINRFFVSSTMRE